MANPAVVQASALCVGSGSLGVHADVLRVAGNCERILRVTAYAHYARISGLDDFSSTTIIHATPSHLHGLLCRLSPGCLRSCDGASFSQTPWRKGTLFPQRQILCMHLPGLLSRRPSPGCLPCRGGARCSRWRWCCWSTASRRHSTTSGATRRTSRCTGVVQRAAVGSAAGYCSKMNVLWVQAAVRTWTSTRFGSPSVRRAGLYRREMSKRSAAGPSATTTTHTATASSPARCTLLQKLCCFALLPPAGEPPLCDDAQGGRRPAHLLEDAAGAFEGAALGCIRLLCGGACVPSVCCTHGLERSPFLS